MSAFSEPVTVIVVTAVSEPISVVVNEDGWVSTTEVRFDDIETAVVISETTIDREMIVDGFETAVAYVEEVQFGDSELRKRERCVSAFRNRYRCLCGCGRGEFRRFETADTR